MALITCPDCGREISEYAESCPGCGCPSSVWQKTEMPSSLQVGDRYTMGTWGGKPIEWRVLEVSEGSALLITEKVIDVLPYEIPSISDTCR